MTRYQMHRSHYLRAHRPAAFSAIEASTEIGLCPTSVPDHGGDADSSRRHLRPQHIAGVSYSFDDDNLGPARGIAFVAMCWIAALGVGALLWLR